MKILGMFVGVTLAVAVLAGPSVGAGAGEEEKVEAMIESAATRADHEALATYFEQQAAEARASAERHERMGARYEKTGGPAIAKFHLDRHCENLAKAYERAAKENEALASAHRTIAGNMK